MGVSRFLFVATLTTCACQGPSPLPPTTVSLRMAGAPPDAIVSIDDQVVGPLDFVQARGVALPPGVHHVTVQASGYFPFDREVKATVTDPPTLLRLNVRLVPIPD
jgi:hypothetical protein